VSANDDWSEPTLLAQAMHAIDETTGAVVPPIYPATTFARNENYDLRNGWLYSRAGNPNYCEIETLLTTLEGGKGAQLFSSGLAAFAAAIQSFKPGAHIVVPSIMYFAAQVWLKRLTDRGDIHLTIFDPSKEGALETAIIPGKTDLLWIETALNPTWAVMDIAYCAELVHKAGGLLAVDSTVTPPVTCKPIKHGADLVYHSATKYLNGHSDVLGGILVCADDNEQWQDICAIRTATGGVMGPFEAWLLLRGMRTLSIRFREASDNAMAIARYFESHPKLEAVLYPGLNSHPGHDSAARQCENGFGGMMSLLVKGGFDEAVTVTKALKLFVPATSLGGVESLVEHRKTIEGDLSDVPANLIRLSVGIESANDLIADLEQALNQL
jgi:cystathionine gamma-synthase